MNWNAPAPSLGGIPDFAGDFGITDAGVDRGADGNDLAPRKAPAEKPWKAKTGSYLDGDYVYFYNAGTDDLYIVLSPKSADRKPVASGSAAYTAIMAAIRNQKATQISAAQVKELRARSRADSLGEDSWYQTKKAAVQNSYEYKWWAGPGALKLGYYMEAGPYVYRYNPGAESIDLVISPKSTKARPVAKGSAAYTAILKKLKAGGMKFISADEVKTMRSKVTTVAAPKAARVAAHAHEEIAEVAPPPPPPPKTSFLDNLPGWAPYAAGGVILSVIASALLLSSPRARLATLEK